MKYIIYKDEVRVCRMGTLCERSIILTREAANCSSGTTAVYTRLPLTTSRISMESVVKARM